MEVNRIIDIIEKFAPLELQEEWDSSGFQVYGQKEDIKKVLLCLSVTKNIMAQAVNKKCDMILSHHPFIFPSCVPFEFNKGITIYSAHTNLDKADGGTTDTLIELLGFGKAQKIFDFLRLVELEKEMSLLGIVNLLKTKLNIETLHTVNNYNKEKIKRIAFCAGSGADFLQEAQECKADLFVTGDVKYHSALESNVIIIDIGHYESERPVLSTIKKLLKPLNIEVEIADEKSPFINF